MALAWPVGQGHRQGVEVDDGDGGHAFNTGSFLRLSSSESVSSWIAVFIVPSRISDRYAKFLREVPDRGHIARMPASVPYAAPVLGSDASGEGWQNYGSVLT